MKIRAALVMLCLSRLAAAGELTLDRTCVEIDADDGLAAPDRARASELMRRVLEREDLLVVTSGCTETFALSHERTGDAYVIHVRSSAGKRRMTTPALDELSAKYEKLVRSLLDAKEKAAALRESEPQPSESQSSDSQPSDSQQPIVPQVAAAELQEPVEAMPTPETSELDAKEQVATEYPYKRNTIYTIVGAQLTGGSAIALGLRARHGSLAYDFAINHRGSDNGTRATNFSFELLGAKQMSPHVGGYIGGGLSAGSMSRGNEYYYDRDYYWGGGVSGEFTTGLQMGKSQGMQVFTQLDLTIPFYEMGNDEGGHDYAAMAVISAGAGF